MSDEGGGSNKGEGEDVGLSERIQGWVRDVQAMKVPVPDFQPVWEMLRRRQLLPDIRSYFEQLAASVTVPEYAMQLLVASAGYGFSKVVATPLDRAKLLLQNQKEGNAMIRPHERYNGALDVYRKLRIDHGRVWPWWRGGMNNFARAFPTLAGTMFLKDHYSAAFDLTADRVQSEQHEKQQPQPSAAFLFSRQFLSGGAAAATVLALVHPFEYVQTRLAVDVRIYPLRYFRNARHCLRMGTRYGIVSRGALYNGFAAGAVGVFLYRGLYFGLYDSYFQVTGTSQSATFLERFRVGAAASVLSSTLTYPIDTVRRRRMITASSSDSAVFYQYFGNWHCARKLIQDEGGIRALYRGAGINAIRAAVAGLGLVSFDHAIRSSGAPYNPAHLLFA